MVSLPIDWVKAQHARKGNDVEIDVHDDLLTVHLGGRKKITTADLKLLIPHQANLRISEMVQRRLELRDDQVFSNIQKYGNTTACSIPLALDEARKAGHVQEGDLIALTAFGAGFTWGAALIRW